jgi:hypothetical protein
VGTGVVNWARGGVKSSPWVESLLDDFLSIRTPKNPNPRRLHQNNHQNLHCILPKKFVSEVKIRPNTLWKFLAQNM